MSLWCRGKTCAVVGWGAIGQECGQLARACGMRVCAMRRRVQLSQAEELAGLQARARPAACKTSGVYCCHAVICCISSRGVLCLAVWLGSRRKGQSVHACNALVVQLGRAWDPA